nr:wax ester/triacylglycerol synthase domain-containing protein [Mycobacterium asiaticum]
MSVGAVAVVDGRVPEYDLIKDLLAERIQQSESDVTPHVQRLALPQPGDQHELFQTIAYVLERPLDPNLPLWECTIIEGLENHRWAVVMKVHQSIAEKLSPAHLIARLCDDADPNTYHVAGKRVSHSEASSWIENLSSVVKAAARAFTGAADVLWPAADSLPTMRRYRTVCFPRAAVERIAGKFGVTADDVALAAVTEGFRTVLIRRGEQPRADSLRALGPVVSYLPVEHDDPIRQLRAVRTEPSAACPTGYSPLTLCTKLFQVLAGTSERGTVTLATDAPGPRQPLQLMGQRLERLLPIPPSAPELSTGVAVLSYGNELVLGITADFAAAAELDQLVTGIELGMARLLALSQDSVLLFDRRRKRPSRMVSGSAPSAPPARARR